jgi:hypothetical protein
MANEPTIHDCAEAGCEVAPDGTALREVIVEFEGQQVKVPEGEKVPVLGEPLPDHAVML